MFSSFFFKFNTGASAKTRSGNKIKNSLDKEVRQVKRRSRRLKISCKFVTMIPGTSNNIIQSFDLLQLEERNIELEGTRAQIRVMEAKLLANRCYDSPEHQSTTTKLSRDGITIMHTSTPNHRLIQSSSTISTPSMKAMIPLVMDDLFQHSSSTESAHDQQERDLTMSKCPETPRRTKPSKIPLPGSIKSAVNVSTKPPSGRQMSTSAGPPSTSRSFTKSTSSLFTASGMRNSGPSSITKRDLSLTRPDSAQSLRNSNSIDGSKTQQQPNRFSSSSIPISNTNSNSVTYNKLIATASPTLTAAYGNTTVVNIPPTSPNKYVNSSPSPVLRPKRDSLTTRVKNLDSLSRLQSSSSSGTLSTNGTATSSATTTLRSNNNSNSNNNQNVVTNGTNNNNNSNRKYTALPVRRMSNVSVRDANTIDHQHHNIINNSANSGNSDANGGKVRNIRSSIWNWLKI